MLYNDAPLWWGVAAAATCGSTAQHSASQKKKRTCVDLVCAAQALQDAAGMVHLAAARGEAGWGARWTTQRQQHAAGESSSSRSRSSDVSRRQQQLLLQPRWQRQRWLTSQPGGLATRATAGSR